MTPATDSSGAGHTPATLDLTTLRAQTGGDRALERDVLALFLVRSQVDFDRVAAGKTAEERRAAAHTLVGSARAVGAFALAASAAAVERTAVDSATGIPRLREALLAAHTLVRQHLGK
jgi:HPt (histidine-containing phosphotransfer) domain-containing protein